METIGTGDIERAVGQVSYLRGLEYFERGRVRWIECDAPGRIHGEVAGSRSKPYAVWATVEHGRDGRPVAVAGHCSCPVGFNCKHVAAVLLSAQELALDGDALKTGRSRDPVSGEVRHWLGRWPEPAAGRADKGRAGPQVAAGEPARSQEHLFYVVHRDALRRAHITPYKAYLRKDGSIGSNFREFGERNPSRTYRYLTVEDASILGRLGFYSNGGYPRHYDWPEGEELIGLIREIVATGRARAGDIRGSALSWGEPRPCALSWSVGESGEQRIVARDGAGSTVTLLAFPIPFFIDSERGEIGVAETALPPRMASWFASAPPVKHGSVDAVAAKLSRVGQHAPVPQLQRVEERAGSRPGAVLTLYGCTHRLPRYAYGAWRGGTNEAGPVVYPCALLEIVYEGAATRLRVGRGDDIAAPGDGGFSLIRRDRGREAAFAEALRDAAGRRRFEDEELLRLDHGLPRELRDADVVFPPLVDEDDTAAASGIGFLSQAVPQLRAEGWRVEIDGTWPYRLHEGPVAFSTSVGSQDSDWFSLRLVLEANGKTFDIAPIVCQLVDSLPVDEWGGLEEGFDLEGHLAGRVFHTSFGDGTWLAMDGSRFVRFAEAFLEAQGLTGFHRGEAGRLFDLAEALEGCGAPWSGGREILDLGARLRSLAEAPEVPAPASLRGELRPYQCAGYGWLRALSDTGFGGVLADDMGLGKTVQTLALLAHRHLEEKAERPSLLVVPTSMVGTWRREAARFVPDLKLLVLHGPDRRRRFAEIADHHLVVTTYPLLNRDHEALFYRDYDVAVLDEAQNVKNPAAAVSKRIREIRARQRLALTGTPLENNLQELWTLYDWLIPGLLGNRKSFTAEFRTPIEKHGDRVRQRLLSARVKPFLMRRTKEEVAQELPEKTVIDELIPLEGAQAALYESIRTAMDERVGEDVTETLEAVPRRWKVIQTVREKFTCRHCEKISQPPAPFHATPRGWAGPNLLATIVFEKYGQHQPLNRQRDRYAREGVDLSLSTLADQVGACTVALRPLHDLIAAHVLAAERLQGDDTPVPVLARGKTATGRAWVYVRDDTPFGGADPPAALFHYSRDRSGDHPVEHLRGFAGILQADAYAGYRRLYEPGRSPGLVTEALCWAHGRRKFFELADIAANKRRGKRAPPISPLALEAVTRIDALFDIEREINGEPAERRLEERRERSAPLLADLEGWMRTRRAGLSRHASVAKAIDYMLKRWDGFASFLDDGRICLTNNAAERALRPLCLGRRSWLFAGSDRGGVRAAAMYTLIGTARLNDVDPQAWLADTLARIAETPQTRLEELLPWNWDPAPQRDLAA